MDSHQDKFASYSPPIEVGVLSAFKVKLGREIGFSKAAKELGINTDTFYGWNKRAKGARLNLGPGTQMPDSAMSLTEEVQKLRQGFYWYLTHRDTLMEI